MSKPRLGDNFLNIAGAATTVVRSGSGTFKRLTVNKAVASGVITIYDNTAASGTIIATITQPATLLQTQYDLEFNCKFTTGLTIVTSAADDITAIWNPVGNP